MTHMQGDTRVGGHDDSSRCLLYASPGGRALGRRAKTLLFVAVVVLAGAIGVEEAFAQTLDVAPLSFGSGQTVKVSGTGFPPGVAVTVWFDSNGDSVLQPGESSNIAGVDGRGAFSGATVLAVGNPGTYSVRAGPVGSTPIASAPVTIASCWWQECTINGAVTVCIIGNSPRDLVSDCKALDSSYSDPPGGYDFTNVGPRFLGATVLAAATNDLGLAPHTPFSGCAAMNTAIAGAEGPPFFNQVPNKASLIALTCSPLPFGLPELVGALSISHPNDAAVTDAQVLLGLLPGIQIASGVLPGGPPLVQQLMASAAVDGAIACGFVDYFCNGADLTSNIIGNARLQASLVPLLPGLPLPGLTRWGDIIGWAQVVCTGTMVRMCPAPTPGSAGNNNSLAPTRCVNGKVVGLSIGYDGDLSFDVNDGFYNTRGELDRSKPGPNVRPLVNFHNFEIGPGGSEAPGGVDVEIPVADKQPFLGTLAQLRKDRSAVFVCGRFVTDMHMGWNELHPVSFVTLQAFPLPPTGVTATPNKNVIRVSWRVLPGVTYEIWRSTPKQRSARQQPRRLIKTGARPPFSDFKTTRGVTYTYVVRAVYPSGRSAFSNAANAARP
jgi:hypothetical protein